MRKQDEASKATGLYNSTSDNKMYKYKLLFENAWVIMLFIKPDGSITDANNAAIEAYRYTYEELLSKNIYDIRSDERKVVYSQMGKAIEQKGIMFETIHKRKDGTTFPVEVISRAVGVSNETILMSIIRDISEQKKYAQEKDELLEQLKSKYSMEQKLSFAARKFLDINLFDDAINFVLEQLGYFTRTDRTFLYMFRDNKGFFNYTHEWCSKGVESKIARMNEIGDAEVTWLRGKMLSGNIVYFDNIDDMPEEAANEKQIFKRSNIKSFITIPIIIANELVGFLGAETNEHYIKWTDNNIYITNTISEIVTMTCIRKRIEDQLMETNKELKSTLEKLNNTQQQLIQQEKLADIGQLASGIAHEINNPLGYVISNNRALEEYTKKYREMIQHYKGLIDDLEEYPNPNLQKKAINLRELEQKKKIDFIHEDIIELLRDTSSGLERINMIIKGLRSFSHSS